MPKTEIDYSNTVIYKITCKDIAVTDVYVGHTTNFVQRKHSHKQSCLNVKSTSHNCKVYQVIRANGSWNNWKMEIINFFDCANHYEALQKEQEYFVLLKATLNSIEPLPKAKVKTVTTINTAVISQLPCDSLTNNKKEHNNLFCEVCDFSSKKESNFNKHLLTLKHKNLINSNKHSIINVKTYDCNCGKTYKHPSTLSAHKQNCSPISIIEQNNNNVVESLIKDKVDLQVIVIDLQKQIMELQKQLLDIHIIT